MEKIKLCKFKDDDAGETESFFYATFDLTDQRVKETSPAFSEAEVRAELRLRGVAESESTAAIEEARKHPV